MSSPSLCFPPTPVVLSKYLWRYTTLHRVWEENTKSKLLLVLNMQNHPCLDFGVLTFDISLVKRDYRSHYVD